MYCNVLVLAYPVPPNGPSPPSSKIEEQFTHDLPSLCLLHNFEELDVGKEVVYISIWNLQAE